MYRGLKSNKTIRGIEMRTYRYNGKNYGDDVWSAVEDAFSEDSFVENYSEEIEICGIKFDDLDVLRRVDNIAFKEAYEQMCDSFATEINNDSCQADWLNIEVVEDDEDEDEDE